MNTMSPSDEDQVLLAELRAALAESEEVPAEFYAAGRAAFAWRGIDAEIALAEVVFDSRYDLELAARATDAAGRRLVTFQADDVTVDIELDRDGITGQVVPAGPGRVVGETPAGPFDETTTDDAGLFVLAAPPSAPFRLRVAYATRTVTTAWLRID